MTSETSTAKKVFFVIAAIVLAGLYVFTVAQAIGNWFGMKQIAETLSDGLSGEGMVWLAVGIIVPVLVFVLAWLVGRKQTIPVKLLLLLLGIGVVAIMQLNIMHLVPTTTYLS